MARQGALGELRHSLAQRMGSRADGRQQRRLLGRALSVWRAAARDSGKVQRAELEAGFAELERSVAVYKAETGQRLEAAQGGAVAHESRCIAAEAAAAEARAEGEAARSELARVKAAASQLGGAMQARVVAAEEETASCRAELQQALREQVRPARPSRSGLSLACQSSIVTIAIGPNGPSL